MCLLSANTYEKYLVVKYESRRSVWYPHHFHTIKTHFYKLNLTNLKIGYFVSVTILQKILQNPKFSKKIDQFLNFSKKFSTKDMKMTRVWINIRILRTFRIYCFRHFPSNTSRPFIDISAGQILKIFENFKIFKHFNCI